MKGFEEEAVRLDREIGARLRFARRVRGLNQAELGRAISVSFQQVQKYELGANRISASALVLLARALEVSPLELLGVEAQHGVPSDWPLLAHDGAETLLRAYKDMACPRRRQVLRELARALSQLGDADEEPAALDDAGVF